MGVASVKKAIICDLDNTLYDWVSYFVPSFYAMVRKACIILGCSEEDLLDSIRLVHQRHHDTEHPFALLETDIVSSKCHGMTDREKYAVLDPAFHEFNIKRKNTLKLYDGVSDTLAMLKAANVLIIAHTESRVFSALDRLCRLGIAHHFDRIYCREKNSTKHPLGPNAPVFKHLDKVFELSRHQQKPDATVLREICSEIGCHADDVAYVGDSIVRDVTMAKSCGILAIWARYGTAHDYGMYEQLVRVSHWTSEDVAREKALKNAFQTVRPDIVIDTFPDLLKTVT